MYLIRPASADLVIPMPTGGDLPAAGIVLPALDLYWVRRATDGDISAEEVKADTLDAAIAEVAAAAKGRKADEPKG